MGTLKDEMKEDRLLGEKAEDGEGPRSSDGTAATDGSLKNSAVESTRQDNEPEMDRNKEGVCVKADAAVDVEKQSVSVAVPSTPDPMDPRSPAPFGQHHMRTQVSLEVVQCHSAATSPMTPPEGGQDKSFFFPSSFGRAEAVGTDTKDVELQVGQQVEYSSVATSPMTPKTPFFSTFPPPSSQKKTEDGQPVGTKKSEISEALKYPAGDAINSESKQQRMGSMDQDITILVTQHLNTEESEDRGDTKSDVQCPVETGAVKEEENEESGKGEDTVVDRESSKSAIKTEEASVNSELKSANSLEAQDNKDVAPESPAPFGCHNMRTQVSLEVVQCQSAATSPMTPPEGDQAFRFPSVSTKCGGIGTETKDAELQVGQQVEYRSIATAPMTPRTPTATTFPEVLKGPSVEEKIVEEEEETESPKEKCGEDQAGGDRGKRDDGGDGGEGGRDRGKEGGEKGGGGEGGDGERGDGDKEGEGGDGGGEGSEGREGEEQTEEEHQQEVNCKEDKCEEPVQEVSWDEKGMTWEVYGAVVEVSVLGSAIQKHLEKQVKKQKNTMPPPPPLNPSATPLGPTEATSRGTGSGKSRSSKRAEKTRRNRRNPFRQMMENMQQPHCCSRAHTTE